MKNFSLALIIVMAGIQTSHSAMLDAAPQDTATLTVSSSIYEGCVTDTQELLKMIEAKKLIVVRGYASNCEKIGDHQWINKITVFKY